MLNNFIIIILVAVSIFIPGTSLGQKLIVERAESKVLIHRNNLVKAKIEALKDAKTKVILQAVSKFLDYDSMIALEPLLKKYFIENTDNFIESIRVTNEKNTNDLSEFNLQIETQIFLSRILSTFRKLGIPKLSDDYPAREVILIYNANKDLRKKGLFTNLLKNLQIRLNPYRIKARVIDIKDKYLPIDAGLKARLKILQNKKTKQINRNILTLLELKLYLSQRTSKIENDNLEAELIFWPQNQILNDSAEISNKAKINLSFSEWNEKKIISEILDGLMLKWTPIINKTIELNKGSLGKIKLVFRGLNGPIEEQLLFKTLFQNNPYWKEVFLDKISLNSVSYKGYFLGNQKNIYQNLIVTKDFPFIISKTFWENNQLIVNTKWRDVYEILDPFDNLDKGNNYLENNSFNNLKIEPILQVPLKTFKNTFKLPLESPVFDHIRHRGDSTLFKIDSPQQKTKNQNTILINIIWSRIGPTNLSPKITLFDKNKKRIKSFLIGKKKQISVEHELNKDNIYIFLRVSDKVGFLEDIAGSYQSFRYILSVKHN